MSDREEEAFFRRYLKKGYSLWGRIKFRLWLLRNNRKVRTIKTVGGDYELMMKIVILILGLMLLRMLGAMIVDIWIWFFPRRVFLPGRWV